MKSAAAPPGESRSCGAQRTELARLLLCTAGLGYNDWVLEFFLPTGLDPRHAYVSELYAVDQPFRAMFAGIEVATAGAVIAGALLARTTAPSRLAETGWWALAGFGACSIADVVLPMRCAPSVEPGCEAVRSWHALTSGLADFALFSSMALLIVAAQRDRPYLPTVRRWGRRVLPAAMGTAIAAVGPLLGRPGWAGVPQRAHLLLAGGWLFLLGAGLPRTAPATAPAPAKPTSANWQRTADE